MHNWLTRFHQYVEEKGLRHSGPRDEVARVFFASGKHIGIEELLRRLHQSNRSIGIATVYRTLNLLVESGLAVRRDFDTGSTAYERSPEKHHDHLLCVGCGKIVEFCRPEIERLQEKVAAQHRFRLESHKMELYGRCVNCQSTTKKEK